MPTTQPNDDPKTQKDPHFIGESIQATREIKYENGDITVPKGSRGMIQQVSVKPGHWIVCWQDFKGGLVTDEHDFKGA
ncbi:MAG: hypothetical protein V4469_04645 [Patescibacteria group bacterium]